MSTKGIPDDIKAQVNEIVARFNEGSGDPTCFYAARFRGSYLYLDRSDFGQIGPICRLKYTGDMDNWEFAIYKFSSERYDPEEWFFPGSEYVDGTVEGAMMAGLHAYPV
ncbi:MAG: hypothetical protein E3J21_15990 [Anaerolineales bacterium]|nr:MAG: hypothetical protein E3J21_15990 [Anaerolineales bacterium]